MPLRNKNIISDPKIHLIFTSIVTNSRLRQKHIKSKEINYKCIDQFLTTVHSMAPLRISSQDFHIELDPEFSSLQNVIEKHILENFPNANINWRRLEYFSEWQLSSRNVPKECDIILLQSNFDHAYVASSPEYFAEFIKSMKKIDIRVIGEITHWPEAISEIASPWKKNQKIELESNYFKRMTSNLIGTSLISKNLYKEIWRNDFTNGKRITRPDNPFGPSVLIQPSTHVTPNIELFRHLDGYSHVGIENNWVKQIDSCCVYTNGSIVHSDWKFCGAKSLVGNEIKCDLPNDSELNEGLPINILIKACSHRINFQVLRKLAFENNKDHKFENLRIIKKLFKFKVFRSKIPRFILDITFGNLLVFILLRDEKTARENFLLSNIMSNGWRSIFSFQFIRSSVYKFFLFLGIKRL